MSWRRVHQIEQAVIMAFGFCLGVLVAMCITAGDVLLWVVAGVLLSIFCRAFFIGDLGGDLTWPFAGAQKHHDKGKDQSGPTHAVS
jgi:hypothetical protein